MADEPSNAVINANVVNLATNFNNHITEDRMHFDRMFNFVEKQSSSVGMQIADLSKQVATLWDNNNQQKGALAASKFAIGCISATAGLIGGVLGWIITHVLKL